MTASLLASAAATATLFWWAGRPAVEGARAGEPGLSAATLRAIGERRVRHREALLALRGGVPAPAAARPLPATPVPEPETLVAGASFPEAPPSRLAAGPRQLPEAKPGPRPRARPPAPAHGLRVVEPPPPETVEPAAGPPLTARRDPLDLPLREEERWQEWLLSVRLNGLEVSGGAFVIREPETDRLAVPVEEMRRWRLRVERDRILTFQGMPFYPLDAIPGARFEVDETDLVLTLEVPPEQFESTVVGGRGEIAGPAPDTAPGAFLDYDLVYEAGRRADEALNGLVEVGLFGDPGVLLTSLRLLDAFGEAELDRLETTFVRDFPGQRATLRIGDSLTAGGSFARSVRFGGIQYGTNFATDPEFVTFPLPTIGGLAEQPSTIEVMVDNVRRLTREVPPGPFTIGNVPVVTGAGEIQLAVTDLLGRTRLVTQSYYVSPRLLREGLHDFSYEAGFLRERFGEASFDYGSPFLAATHRYGFDDRFTGELHAEAEPDRVAAIAGGALRVGDWGVVSGGIGGSVGDDGSGPFLQGSYEYVGRRFDFGVRTRYLGRGLELFGESGLVARSDAVNLGLRLGEASRLGLILAHQVRRDDEDVLSASASFSTRIGPGALIANAAALLEPERDLSFTLAYTLPLGNYRAATAQLDMREDRMRARAQFRQGRGATDLGLDWRIAAEAGEDARWLDARLSWQGSHGEMELEADGDSDGVDLRLGASGTAAFVAGRAALTRRVGRAFGLVRVPGLPGVRVYLDNREVGRTDERGELLVPGLRPYSTNRLRLEVEDLPLGAVPERTEIEIVPADRGAVVAEFPLRLEARATARLLDPDGTPLPAGLELRSADGAVSVLVAREGFAQIVAAGPLPARVRATDVEPARVCELPALPPDDPLPDLGDLRCDTL